MRSVVRTAAQAIYRVACNLKFAIALASIRFGVLLLDAETHAEVLRQFGVAGRKGII